METGITLQTSAVLLLIVFAISLAGLLSTVRAERSKAQNRLRSVAVKYDSAEVSGHYAMASNAVSHQSQKLARNLRPSAKRASINLLVEFLAAGGFRRSIGYYVNVLLLVGIGLSLMLWLVVPVGVLSIPIGLLLAVGTFYFIVKRSIRGRLKIIEREFPSAIDIIVRGVRSGMPLNEGMRLVASEAHPLIAKEFTVMLDELALGVPISECIRRMAERMPIPDIQYFSIVLSLQASSGGSVANALEACAETIRSRRALRQKVIVMSNEARASAIVIGSLPIFVMLIMSFTSPDYIAPLFNTTLGNVALAGTGVWMTIGILVMRSMINFEV